MRETRVYDRDRLLRVTVFEGEVATLDNFKTERGEVLVGDRLEVALRPIAFRYVRLTVDLVTAAVREGHAETVTHGSAIEGGVGP